MPADKFVIEQNLNDNDDNNNQTSHTGYENNLINIFECVFF